MIQILLSVRHWSDWSTIMEQRVELVKHCFFSPASEEHTSDSVTSTQLCVNSSGHTYICESISVLDDHALHASLTPPPPQPPGISYKNQGNHQNGSCHNGCHGRDSSEGVRLGIIRRQRTSSPRCKPGWRLIVQQVWDICGQVKSTGTRMTIWRTVKVWAGQLMLQKCLSSHNFLKLLKNDCVDHLL